MKRIVSILVYTLMLLVWSPINAYSNTDFDFSSCNLIIKIMFIDSNGKKTGYDPKTGQKILEEFPNVQYGGTGGSDGTVAFFCNGVLGSIPSGSLTIFQILTTGLKLDQYSIGLNISESTDLSLHTAYKRSVINGLSDIGKSDTYQLTYVPYQPLKVIRVASPGGLIADINTASKLGFIGNAKFVSELIKEVQKIEKERLHPEENVEHDPATPAQRAIKKYQQLLKEIKETCQKPEADEFVKQEAYTVLKEDIEYIIAHIQ